ncbi:YbaB/EbfC family nucleoid-associated protein [Streptomyces sp. NBC_01483]|uniref:YbaB/EbfC family nucleoid-associated protein n=1 Tax=Streptomyces sp. NBC_01483 TaxID=2903883 RepID=UPI002E2FBEEE|nr:YbaB/EbfC family nucleoid-associated protein [Streptomyces sp. NBC_01483]
MTTPLGSHRPDMQQFFQQAQAMQRNLLNAQQELATLQVQATSGNGAVRATVSGSAQLQRLDIAPEVADPHDTEGLAALVLAAIREATESAKELAEQKLMPTIAQTFTDSIGVNLQGVPGGN